jgi:hypothetical protein
MPFSRSIKPIADYVEIAVFMTLFRPDLSGTARQILFTAANLI